MKLGKIIILTILIGFLLSNTSKKEDWGFFAHQRINRMAVFTLPPDMIIFHKKYIEHITRHAIDPDKRRYLVDQEAPRHYIDLDMYGTFPFEEVPRPWYHALAKFTDVFVVKNSGDTMQIFGDAVAFYQKDSMILKGKWTTSLFEQDSLIVSTKRYVDFVKGNIGRQFYELDWRISLQNLDTLFYTEAFTSHFSEAFAEDILSEHGIVPWHLEAMLSRLTRAFQERDKKKILRYTSDIGHYIGDAHVPLHTTKNYNGQLTNQVGIHGFWESRLPELFAEDYNYFVGKAAYIEQPNTYFWDIVLTSHSLLDSVLLIEKSLTEQFGTDQKYCYETRNTSTVRTYCNEFSAAYHNRLSGMVEQRMRDAILSVGSVWYTAWVNAGQPNLRQLMEKEIVFESEDLNIQDKKIKGRKH